MCKTNKSKFLAGWIKGIILGTQLLSFYKLGLNYKLLLEHVILVSAQVPLVLTLGLWTLGLPTWA